MDSTDSSLLEAILSDDNDTRNKAEVSVHDDLAPMGLMLHVYWCSQEKFRSLPLDNQLQLLVSVFAKTTVEQVGDSCTK